MKPLLTTIFIAFTLSCSAQDNGESDAVYNLTIPYRPAFVKIFSGVDSITSQFVNNIEQVTYMDFKPGQYILQISWDGQPTSIREDIVVTKNQRLILKFNIQGPCLYDHPAGYIPVCPRNHKDSIIPIRYGLLSQKVDYTKDRKDMTYKVGGCVITECDPQFYCKEHDIEF